MKDYPTPEFNFSKEKLTKLQIDYAILLVSKIDTLAVMMAKLMSVVSGETDEKFAAEIEEMARKHHAEVVADILAEYSE